MEINGFDYILARDSSQIIVKPQISIFLYQIKFFFTGFRKLVKT